MGVRLERNSPVLYVAAGACDARPGDRVLIEFEAGGGESEAIVAIGPDQVIFSGGVRPVGCCLRHAADSRRVSP